MNHALQNVKNEVEALARKISAPKESLPTYEYSKDFARPHIEVDQKGHYHFVVVERGVELERKITPDPEELLYWIFKGVTFTMACHYELEHRVADKDHRRILFANQAELLGILNKTWKEKQMEEHHQILKEYPFDDFAGLRATYCSTLRAQGRSESEIAKLAYEKYPKE